MLSHKKGICAYKNVANLYKYFTILLHRYLLPSDKCFLCSILSYLFVLSLSLFMCSIFLHSRCVCCSISSLPLLVFVAQSISKASSLSILDSLLALCAKCQLIIPQLNNCMWLVLMEVCFQLHEQCFIWFIMICNRMWMINSYKFIWQLGQAYYLI
jgi:hypothetical protein